jgi:hypothetical protein
MEVDSPRLLSKDEISHFLPKEQNKMKQDWLCSVSMPVLGTSLLFTLELSF